MTATMIKPQISPDKFIAAFAEAPEIKAMLEANEKRRVQAHKTHAKALIELDKIAESAFSIQQTEQAAAIARRDAAWRAYQEAQTDLTRLVGRHSGESSLRTQERGRLEALLIATSHPAIAEFLQLMDSEWDRARGDKTVIDNSTTLVNPVTGKKTHRPGEAIVTQAIRLQKIREAMQAAAEMHLLPDQVDVPGRLKALFDALPVVGQKLELRP